MRSVPAVLALLTASLACDGGGPSPGRVERVSPSGASFAFEEPVVVDIGERERFTHRYRFASRKGEPVWISAEAAGVLLEIDVGRQGARPYFKRGPKTQLRERFVAREDGAHDLVVRGEADSYGNSYRLVVEQGR